MAWAVQSQPLTPRSCLQGPSGSPPTFISLLFYVATDGQGTLRPLVVENSRLASLTGTTEELGDFTVTFQRPTTEAGATPLYARYVASWTAALPCP